MISLLRHFKLVGVYILCIPFFLIISNLPCLDKQRWISTIALFSRLLFLCVVVGSRCGGTSNRKGSYPEVQPSSVTWPSRRGRALLGWASPCRRTRCWTPPCTRPPHTRSSRTQHGQASTERNLVSRIFPSSGWPPHQTAGQDSRRDSVVGSQLPGNQPEGPKCKPRGCERSCRSSKTPPSAPALENGFQDGRRRGSTVEGGVGGAEKVFN